MITDGRKYVIQENAGIFLDVTKLPDTLQALPGDDYINTRGLAIGMRVTMADVEVPITLCMTDADTKALIKALKKIRRKYRREVRTKW